MWYLSLSLLPSRPLRAALTLGAGDALEARSNVRGGREGAEIIHLPLLEYSSRKRVARFWPRLHIWPWTQSHMKGCWPWTPPWTTVSRGRGLAVDHFSN